VSPFPRDVDLDVDVDVDLDLILDLAGRPGAFTGAFTFTGPGEKRPAPGAAAGYPRGA